MNYYDTFILIAPDSSATRGTAPPQREGAPSIAAIEFTLLSAKPYGYTQEELLFAVHLHREGISPAEARSKHDSLWDQFFSKSRACLRASALPKKYGWGLHFNPEGRIALVAVDSPQYAIFSKSENLKVLPAMRSKRA